MISILFGRKTDSTASDPATTAGYVVADATRCVQCGMCGYNCPMGIDVRSFARHGVPIINAGCLECGTCIRVCPRGTLRWAVESVSE